MICPHKNITWPMRLAGSEELTVFCFDCCRRLKYDWDAMQIVEQEEEEHAAA